MEKLVVSGGRQLHGELSVSGSKNSTLAIIVAAALANGTSVLENVPSCTDIETIRGILHSLGVKTESLGPGRLAVCADGLDNYRTPYDLVRKIRASFYVTGLLLARLGRAEVPFPGGDDLGSRPVDFHIKGFQALGAEVTVEHGYVKAEAKRLVGTKYFVGRASVGTTVNLVIAATLAQGTTILENAARDPEIVDLANYLNAMGARIKGAGTNVIKIEGVRELRGTRHEMIPDRLETGTYMIAVGLTGGQLTVTNALPGHLGTVITKLQEAGVEVEETQSGIRVSSRGRVESVDIETAMYPGFPTDLQGPFAALMSKGDGVSVIRENVHDSRFKYVDGLRMMGADIKMDRDLIIVKGVSRLSGAPLTAPPDIRGSVALVLAGLGAEGETEIQPLTHIDRGYYQIEEKLASVGAEIRRVKT